MSPGRAAKGAPETIATLCRLDDADRAAITGALLGARWGASAIPDYWREILHGHPGLRGEELVHLAHVAATG